MLLLINPRSYCQSSLAGSSLPLQSLNVGMPPGSVLFWSNAHLSPQVISLSPKTEYHYRLINSKLSAQGFPLNSLFVNPTDNLTPPLGYLTGISNSWSSCHQPLIVPSTIFYISVNCSLILPFTNAKKLRNILGSFPFFTSHLQSINKYWWIYF